MQSSSSSSMGMSLPPAPSLQLHGADNYVVWYNTFTLHIAAAGLTDVLTLADDPHKGTGTTAVIAPSPPGGGADVEELKKYVAQAEAYAASVKVRGLPWAQRAAQVRMLILRWVGPEVGSTLSLTDSPALMMKQLESTYGRSASRSFFGLKMQLQEIQPLHYPNPHIMYDKMRSLVKELEGGGAAFAVSSAALCRMFYDKLQGTPQFATLREMYRTKADTGKLVDEEFDAFLDAVQSSYEEFLVTVEPPATRGLLGHTGEKPPRKGEEIPPKGADTNVHATTTCKQCKAVGHTKTNCSVFREYCRANNLWRFEGGTVPADKKEPFLKAMVSLFEQYGVRHVPGVSTQSTVPPPQRGTYRRQGAHGTASGMFTEVHEDEDEDSGYYAGGYYTQVVHDVGHAHPAASEAPAVEVPPPIVSEYESVFQGFGLDSTPYLFPSVASASVATPMVSLPVPATPVEAELQDAISEESAYSISGGTMRFPSTDTMWAVIYHWLPTVVMLCAMAYAGVPSIQH